METFTDIFEDINSVDDNAFSGFKKKLLWVKECFGHPLNLFIVMMVYLAAMVEHITDI